MAGGLVPIEREERLGTAAGDLLEQVLGAEAELPGEREDQIELVDGRLLDVEGLAQSS